MDVKDFNYYLPEELIAQDPLEDRASSRLMVLDRITGAVEHRGFRDILDYLETGDCLVLNDTRVIPARLLGVREETGAHVEILLLRRQSGDRWECLVRPGKKLRQGTRVVFGEGLLRAEIEEILETGNRIVRFAYDGIFEEVLDRLGEMPLPPYITHRLRDKNRYQTVYAVHDGSAAAPTAGLHFTKELLNEIRSAGIDIAQVTLHVGLGTFRPVKAETIEEHHMHSEWYEVSRDAADRINRAILGGHRVISVGTTSTRTMESAAVRNPEYLSLSREAERSHEGNYLPGADSDMLPVFPKRLHQADGRIVPEYLVAPGSGETEIFIHPGYEWKIVDRLITNFHLPQSTLIMLVSALAGRKAVLRAYEEAVKQGYRFFSFGDATLIK